MTKNIKHPILLLEINEVPWRVIDHYLAKPGYQNLKTFFSRSKTYTTVAVDSGELSPWVTWPSIHRGMPNTAHCIANLGQSPATFAGVPIWQEFRNRGLSIGVCGSLQSWPPQDPGKHGFYIPDTFAHDEQCIPAKVSVFQRFNLGMVKENGREVSRKIASLSDLWKLVVALPSLGIRVQTILAVLQQLLMEKVSPCYLARRPIFQGVLMWDVFRKLYNPKNPPGIATFFTNHVAGVMHRYWDHVFPEDFGREGIQLPHKNTMDFAMDFVDKILGQAMDYVRQNNDLRIIFATSMGQAAINRKGHQGYEASVRNLDKLLFVLGFEPTEGKKLMAMTPQVALEVANPITRADLKTALLGARTISGHPMFSVDERDVSLSITVRTPAQSDITAGYFFVPFSGMDDKKKISFEDAGIDMLAVTPGTAYHIPEGVMAVYSDGSAPEDIRVKVQADRVKDLMLDLAFT